MSLFVKIIVLYALMAIGCLFWQPQIIIGHQAPSVMDFFNFDTYNSTTNTPVMPAQPAFSGYMANFTNTENTNNSTGNIFSRIAGVAANVIGTIIDGLSNVMDVVITLFRIIFSPVIIMTSPQMADAPLFLVIMFGYMPTMLFLIAIIFFIRGIYV